MAEDGEGALQAVVDVEIPFRRALVVGELLDCHYEFGDARNAFLDGADQRDAGDERAEPVKGVRE